MRQQLGILITLVFLSSLPFINKPFHIDDSAFIEIAENILQHPLDPFYGSTALVDDDYLLFKKLRKNPNTFQSMSHPPLLGYFIALVVLLTGRISEISLHLAYFGFTILAAISAYSIAKRFSKFPFFSSLLFICSPIFLVNSQNIMTDMPMLAFTLASLALFIRGVDENKNKLLLVSGLLLGLALVTRYAGFYLVPLLPAYVLIQKKNINKALIGLSVAGIVFGLWVIENIIHHGQIHLIVHPYYYSHFYPAEYFNFEGQMQKAIGNLSAIGGTSIFAILLIFFKSNRARTFLMLGISILLSYLILEFDPFRLRWLQNYSALQWVLFLICLSWGLFLLISSIESGLRKSESPNVSHNADRIFVLIWFAFAFAGSTLILPFATGRYMMPVLLPLIILVSNSWGKYFRENASTRLLGGVTIVATLCLSLFIAYVDYQYASSYKNFAASIRQRFPKQRIWFIGEWGFRFYMKQVGGFYLLSSDSSPARKDVIVRSEIAGLHWMSNDVKARCEPLPAVHPQSNFPIRVMNFDAKAGFYSHGFGFLPYSFSDAPLEKFDICQVR